ncbi:DUF5683 domain-containing protein [Hymenobacter sp. 15J16-1T3B]|uniref:DUF5683 domain-containing protein n=1 Tax=Hymenobacter sp. 15J16-1T3B TaxID=2886941 RepID=UPI001D12A856|nr:DUF5683 domain-containing protein [Hymenobacter sp. 15J16-1T3B]MCC3157438.1 DUF5683 domain-containing protein [Hymenobacter sp. 15J16-1T3B]
MAPLLPAVGLFCLTVPAAQAQTVTAGPDSVKVQAGPTVADSLRRNQRLLWMRVTRPQKAVLLAAMLPGAGQVYNHKYWKLPLVYAALGGTVYGEVFYWKRYKEFKAGIDARRLRQSGIDPAEDPRAIDTGDHSKQYSQDAAGDAQQANALNFYRTNRDVFFAYIGLAYGAQILDALVDGHLHDFDVSDNLSLNVQPYALPIPGSPAVGLAFTFTPRLATKPVAPRRF